MLVVDSLKAVVVRMCHVDAAKGTMPLQRSACDARSM